MTMASPDTPPAAVEERPTDADADAGSDSESDPGPLRSTLMSHALPAHMDPPRYIPPLEEEEPASDGDAYKHLRDLDPADRYRAEVLISLMLESENIKNGKLDIPELKNPTISYRIPRRIRDGGAPQVGRGPAPKGQEVKEEERRVRTAFELNVREPMTPEAAKAAAEKAIAGLASLDISAELSKAGAAAEPTEATGKGKGKGKEVATADEAVDVAGWDADGDIQADIHKGVVASLKTSREENAGESSSSTQPAVGWLAKEQEEEEDLPAPVPAPVPVPAPAPDLWPHPISKEEALALDKEDQIGPASHPSYITLPPATALAQLESTPATSPHYPTAHLVVSNAYQQTFRTTGHSPTLASALRHGRIAVSLLAPPRRFRIVATLNLAEVLILSHLHHNAVDDLSAAITMLRRVLSTIDGNERLHAPVILFLFRLYGRRYDALRNPSDLDASIAYGEEMVSCDRPGQSMADLNLQLGQLLLAHGDVDKAIGRFELAAALSGEDADLRAKALMARVDAVVQRGRFDKEELTAAALQLAFGSLPDSHPARAMIGEDIKRLLGAGPSKGISELESLIESGDGDVETLSKLSEALWGRHLTQRNPEDGNRAIEAAEIALAATEPCEDAAVYGRRLRLLAQMLQGRYMRLGSRQDLDQCIELWERAAGATTGETQRGVMGNASAAHYMRHKHTAGAADLDRALVLAQAALDGTERSNPEYGGRLLNLANCYTGRFRVYGTRGDIDTGIAAMRRALDAARDEHTTTDAPGILSNLGAQLLLRYQAFGSPADLSDAIALAEQSLRETPEGAANHAERALNLASMLEWKRGERSSMERALSLTKAALQKIPKGHRIEAGTLAMLAKRLQALHRGSEQGIDAAVLEAERAAAAAKVGHPDRAHVLGVLAATYRVRYERAGNVRDLEGAVESGTAAVAHCSGEATATKGEFLSELSASLSLRFLRIGTRADLEMAARTAREALDCTPAEHEMRPERLIELCQRLVERFKHTAAADDLLSAITLGGLCLERTARDDRHHSRRLVIVADALHLRHDNVKLFWNDLERATIMTENALVLYRGGPIGPPEIRHRLGRLMRSHYCLSRDIRAISKAVAYLEEAAMGLDGEMAGRAAILDDLARCYLIRYQALGNKGPDGERSHVTFLEAWNSTNAPPLTRLRAASRVCTVLAKSGRLGEAADMYEQCMELMPRVTPPSLLRTDRQALIQTLSGLPTLAASAALEAGRGAERALRLLELGRGVMASFTIDCRSDTSDLQAEHPRLYEEFNSLRRELDSTMGHSGKQGALADQLAELAEGSTLSRRKRAVERMESVLAGIRSHAAYENFLLPPTGAELKRMADKGPIVVFNSAMDRCDAIIVTTTAIRSLRLPEWDFDEACRQMTDMSTKIVRGPVQTYAERNAKMKRAMEWLWRVVVEPVLSAMEIDGREGVMPQVWWVGSGPLSLAPFHAAGEHAAGSTQNTISRVISSYIPTVKALTYARQKKPPSTAAAPRASSPNILLVTMPTTPDECDLHGAAKEASHIADMVGADSTTTLTHPSASEVLARLSSHTAIHFACHGISDSHDPSRSALLLRAPDGTQDRLTVDMVSQASTETAQVAYLSACSTAENSAHGLADETIHLAGAFMLAGFRNVVATLWASADDACVEVAGGFYRGLLVDGVGPGVAMHRAIVELRRRRPGKLLMWAPFIHTGA